MADEKVLAAPIDRIPFITQWKYVTRSSPHPTSPVDRFIEVYWEPPIREPRHATEEEEGAGILWFSAPQIAEAVGITPATRSSAMAAGYLRTFPRKYIAKLSTFPQPDGEVVTALRNAVPLLFDVSNIVHLIAAFTIAPAANSRQRKMLLSQEAVCELLKRRRSDILRTALLMSRYFENRDMNTYHLYATGLRVWRNCSGVEEYSRASETVQRIHDRSATSKWTVTGKRRVLETVKAARVRSTKALRRSQSDDVSTATERVVFSTMSKLDLLVHYTMGADLSLPKTPV